MDPEPHRCRRTNGEKWRCSRDVLPGQKFCDRHVYRSRNSSKIPTPAADGDMNITKPNRGGRPKGSKNKTKGMSSDKSNVTSINSNMDDAPPPPPLVFKSRKVVQPMDPEPGRCWRNDGHRWRCYKDVLPGQKYCEHHFNYHGRKSSRIPAAAAVGDTNISKPNRGGRPKGSKNRIKGMSFDKSNGTSINSNMDDAPPPLDGVAEGGSSSEMRLGGDSWLEKRPIKKPLRFCDAATDKQIKPKRGGRPMGSKNRVKGSTNKSHGTNSDINDDLGANNIKKKKKKIEDESVKQIFIRSDSSYLITLGQTHSGWIFGAIAELVDNARDAKATKVEIFVEYNYSKKAGEMIPMLSVIDDGHGMSHQEVLTLLSFGNKRSVTHDDHDRLGRFGIGFKTGSMKLGRDVILLSQTTESRSIAFLSQSVNADKDNLVTPVVSFSRKGTYMEVDTSIQSKASAAFHLKPIKAFSPFNKYFIGEKLGLFGKNGQGTQIYIWNLDKWGSDFSLEWQKREKNTPSEKDDDILIRSRRIRSRPGQISQKVPLDYSLRSYLEVIFLNPRMKIYVQGSMVNCRPLAKSLNNTKIYNGEPVMGKPVQLTLGRSQQEWERRNCGIFLYWHGRLIEAYKRVGAMINNPDVGRGVIGVIDVSDYMRDGDVAHVHNTKQSFLDIELYAELEKWLGTRADEYWDDHFDTLPCYKPDNEWVQCEKCRKWRMLSSNFDTTSLPQEWFCCMRPYNGECETPEEEIQPSAVTVDAETSEEDLEPEPVKVGLKRSRSNDRKGESVAVYVRGRHVLQGTSKCK